MDTETRRPLAVVLDEADWFVKMTEAMPEGATSEELRRSGQTLAVKLIKELMAHLEVDE